MPLFSVNTNNSSLIALKNLTRTNVGLNKSVQKLSSGSRINSSSDDAAGLSISENLQSQTGGYRTLSNGIKVNDPISKAVQTLSAGMRGNNSSDDAAGLSATENPEAGDRLYRQTPSNGIQIYAALPSVEEVRGVLGNTLTRFTEDPKAALEMQANTSPERVLTLLRS